MKKLILFAFLISGVLVQGQGTTHRFGSSGSTPSDNVSYDNSTSGLAATNIKDAIDEVALLSGSSVTGLPLKELSNVAAYNALSTAQKMSDTLWYILPAIPSGYSAAIDQTNIDGNNDDALSFTYANAEPGSAYDYSITSSGGAGSVDGFGTIVTATDQLTGIDVTALPDGTLTLSTTLTNAAGAGTPATDTVDKNTAPSGNAPPLDGNANPELITGNAAGFGAAESSGTTGITALGATVSNQNEPGGTVGTYTADYYVRVDANGSGGYERAEHQAIAVSSSTTYEYALLYQHSGGSGAGGRFRVAADVSGIIEEVNGLSTGTWTLVTGTFTTGASDTDVDVSVWCQRPFTSADGTEIIEYKLTIKEQ